MMRSRSGLAVAASGAVFAVALLASSPASALTGAEAIRTCDIRAGCRSNVGSNGDVVVIYGGHVIWCDGMEGGCIVVARPNFSDQLASNRADAILPSRAQATTITPTPAPPAPTPTPATRDHRRRN